MRRSAGPQIRILPVALRVSRHFGPRTLRSQDISRKVFRIGTVRYNWPLSAHASQAFSALYRFGRFAHFGTIRLVPKCPDNSAPVPKCLADTLALVPNCLDLQQTFFCYNSHTEERFTVILLVIIKED